VLKKWKERFGPEIYEVISSFANVDYDFVDYIGTAPGIEEEFMLSFIIDFVEGGKYDVVVWDTAPAGHTLRLLKLPQLFLKHLEAATKFYMNLYSYVEKAKGTITMKGSKRTLLEIIRGWEELSEGVVRFIRDRNATKYVIATIPEALGVKQTTRIMDDFAQNGLTVENLVINHVIRDEDCEFHKQRKRMQQQYIDHLKDVCGALNIVMLYLSAYEVKGLLRIADVAGELFSHSSREVPLV
jgi:arsenite/tail-anchored protein-transporting ATPase